MYKTIIEEMLLKICLEKDKS